MNLTMKGTEVEAGMKITTTRISRFSARWVGIVLALCLTSVLATAISVWALTDLTHKSLEPLVSDFNRDKGKVRLVTFLDPT